MGLPAAEIDSALRISFSHENTVEQTEKLAEALEEGRVSLQSRLRKNKSTL